MFLGQPLKLYMENSAVFVCRVWFNGVKLAHITKRNMCHRLNSLNRQEQDE